jgi:G protein-coupled glucose receptor regulating Gpa2
MITDHLYHEPAAAAGAFLLLLVLAEEHDSSNTSGMDNSHDDGTMEDLMTQEDRLLLSSAASESSSSYNYSYLSEERYYWYFFLQVFSASLSMVGSLIIIYLVLLHRRKRWEVYHRLLLSLSLADVAFDLSILFQFPLVRRDTGHPLAIGNITSCTAVGFWTTWSFSMVNLFFVVLSVYFVLTVRYGKNERQVRRYIEPYGYIVAIGLPLAICIAGVYGEAFNPVRIVPTCFMRPYPSNCYVDDTVECERGEHALPLFLIMSGSVFSTMLLGIVCTWLVYWTVRKQQRRNLRYSFQGGPTTMLAEANRKRMRMISRQAICYTAVFLNGIFATLFCSQLETLIASVGVTSPQRQAENEKLLHNTALAVCISLYLFLCPLQGIMNVIIYGRPCYLVWRELHPHQTRWWAIRQILHGKNAKMTPRMIHLVDGNVNEEAKLDANLDRTDTSRTLPVQQEPSQRSSSGGPWQVDEEDHDRKMDDDETNNNDDDDDDGVAPQSDNGGGDYSPSAHSAPRTPHHRRDSGMRVSFSECNTITTPTNPTPSPHHPAPLKISDDVHSSSSNSSSLDKHGSDTTGGDDHHPTLPEEDAKTHADSHDRGDEDTAASLSEQDFSFRTSI